MRRRTIAECRVVLTGASSGIGAALAGVLAARGARLILVARNRERLEKLAADLADGEASQVEVIAGDVTEEEVRRQIVEKASELWGAIDLLINNAGVSAHGRFAENSPDTFRQIMEVNLFAAAELTRRALPLLGAGNSPMVVNMGSILGHRGAPLNSEYSASKFALRGWSEALRAELTAERIDVLLVSPGTTNTNFFDHLLEKRTTMPWSQGKGISPAAVAKQTVNAIERGRNEIFPNWRGRLMVAANRWLPGVVDWVMNRYGRRINNQDRTKDQPT